MSSVYSGRPAPGIIDGDFSPQIAPDRPALDDQETHDQGNGPENPGSVDSSFPRIHGRHRTGVTDEQRIGAYRSRFLRQNREREPDLCGREVPPGAAPCHRA
jgi:hypothetical protein